MSYQHLQEEQYYEDLYDLSTIKECLRCIEFHQGVREKMEADPTVKDEPEEEKRKALNYFLNMELMQRKAENFRKRRETIQEWVERDRVKQDREDNTPAPINIPCTECGSAMQSTHKHLEDYTDEPLRVLFFFDCPNCKKRRGIYEDGEEKVVKPQLCAKCGGTLTSASSEKDEVLTTTTTCSSCDFSETEVDDFKAWRSEREQREQRDKELLEKYRDEFCFTEEEGKKHIELVEAMQFAADVFEYEKQKHDDPDREAVSQLKRLNGADLEKLLAKPLEEAQFEKLVFDRPEIGQHIVLPLTVQDADSTRRSSESERELQKALKPLLEDTNWRLIDGLTCRLGFVSGRLKGYERDEDLLKLTRKVPAPAPKELDPEKQMRLGHHGVVRLARLNGQMQGIENRRKRRLEQEPDGFFLSASEGPYTCFICGKNKYGNEIWWDLYGMKCNDCQRNINEGVIPIGLSKNDKLWFKDWQVSSHYGVHSATARKLRREGVLKGRDLKDKDGKPYCTVYLVEENQEFLAKYPKKEKRKIVFKDSEGNEIVS